MNLITCEILMGSENKVPPSSSSRCGFLAGGVGFGDDWRPDNGLLPKAKKSPDGGWPKWRKS